MLYKYFKDSISLIPFFFFFHKLTKKKKNFFQPLPHTTRITNTKPFFFPFFSQPHLLALPFISHLSLFYSTVVHTAHTSSHIFFFQVSTPLSFFLWLCFTSSKLLLHQRGESENWERSKWKIERSRQTQRKWRTTKTERWSPVIDWRLDHSRANEREMLHKGRFCYILIFFVLHFE